MLCSKVYLKNIPKATIFEVKSKLSPNQHFEKRIPAQETSEENVISMISIVTDMKNISEKISCKFIISIIQIQIILHLNYEIEKDVSFQVIAYIECKSTHSIIPLLKPERKSLPKTPYQS